MPLGLDCATVAKARIVPARVSKNRVFSVFRRARFAESMFLGMKLTHKWIASASLRAAGKTTTALQQ